MVFRITFFSILFFNISYAHVCPACICQEYSSFKSEQALDKKHKFMINKINKKLDEIIKGLQKIKKEKEKRLKKLQLIYKLKLRNSILISSIKNNINKQENYLILELKKINLLVEKTDLKNKKNLKDDIIFIKNIKQEKK